MSSYFSSFSLNKFTDSISNAAHKTQDTLSNAISNIQLDDPQAMLSLKARKHHLQETLGTIEDISKLPPQYQFLEKKCDSLERVCRRMLLVTQTFEVEGYDYPPNLSESISDWWSSNKDGLFSFVNSSNRKETKPEPIGEADALATTSLAQAISKAARDSGEVLKGLKEEEKRASAPQENDEEEEEDQDISRSIKLFEAWADCEHKMDQGKAEMDSLMAKEFNSKLSNLVDTKFKNGRILRKKVEESRLKFDTMRYEVKLKEQQIAGRKEKGSDAAVAPNEDSAEHDESKPESTSAKTESSEHKLLEKLEDEFVSNTTEAVEVMGEITDSAELINLVKLFHNFQLLYHRQCVKELEGSLEQLNELETDAS
ncbi:LAFA_0D06810g1_1 [Lachancea sp. 'fantastica']|nr:LAFA_0D06810g1_1 [Lachancea sp. 'fantastica']